MELYDIAEEIAVAALVIVLVIVLVKIRRPAAPAPIVCADAGNCPVIARVLELEDVAGTALAALSVAAGAVAQIPTALNLPPVDAEHNVGLLASELICREQRRLDAIDLDIARGN